MSQASGGLLVEQLAVVGLAVLASLPFEHRALPILGLAVLGFTVFGLPVLRAEALLPTAETPLFLGSNGKELRI